ncbi:hypothetical protein [Saccharopolyspora rosea]|uniref:Uncharacterized protein n=1 Tax=Saccharopolyspora rosea TaxID=524884 RepID=A0ABW3FYW9_9PSEU|nr:hypothetical protein [Saccharopolyspora rosea]
MLFTLTFHVPGSSDITVTDDMLTRALGEAVRGLVPASALRDTLDRTAPFLPAIAAVAGAGPAGQLAVQATVALARQTLGTPPSNAAAHSPNGPNWTDNSEES